MRWLKFSLFFLYDVKLLGFYWTQSTVSTRYIYSTGKVKHSCLIHLSWMLSKTLVTFVNVVLPHISKFNSKELVREYLHFIIYCRQLLLSLPRWANERYSMFCFKTLFFFFMHPLASFCSNHIWIKQQTASSIVLRA